jgi:hypothetical protein
MFKKLLKFVSVVVILVILTIGFLAYQIFHPERVLNRFHQCLVNSDFDEAYECLSWEAKDKISRHEFITELSSIIPFEIPETYRPQAFNSLVKAVEFDLGEKSLFTEDQYVMLRIAIPAERAINRVINRYVDFQIRKARLDSLAEYDGNTELIFEEHGLLMIDVLDSLLVIDRSEMFQYFDVEEIKLKMEFEFWRWKITEDM